MSPTHDSAPTKNVVKSTTVPSYITFFATGALVLLGLGVVLYMIIVLYLSWNLRTIDRSATPIVNAMLSAIQECDIADTYAKLAPKKLQETVPSDEYRDLSLAIASNLGMFKSKSLRSFAIRNPNEGFAGRREIDVEYDGTFTHGSASIRARLTEINGEWKLLTFWVDSPLLGKTFMSVKCSICGRTDAVNGHVCPACRWAVAGTTGF